MNPLQGSEVGALCGAHPYRDEPFTGIGCLGSEILDGWNVALSHRQVVEHQAWSGAKLLLK